MFHLHALWPRLASFFLFLLLWQLGAMALESRLLPLPEAVFAVLRDGFQSGEIPHHIGITLGRVAASFVLAMAIGSAIGIAMGRSRLLDRLFDAWLVLFLNVPALVVILLAYVWFGLIEAAAVLAVAVNKIPNVAVTLREGSRALDRDYLEMAHSFRLGSLRTFRHVVLPQLSPYFLASARSGLALIWKIVLVVELLGRSDGVGFQLHLYFQLFDVASILAYTLAFVAVVLVIEAVCFRPLDRRALRWRR